MDAQYPTTIHRAFNGKWKYVEAAMPFLISLILVLQGLVVYIWNDHVNQYDKLQMIVISYEKRFDAVEKFQAEVQGNRFTTGDAINMQNAWQGTMKDEFANMKNCMNLILRGFECD